MKTSTVLTAVGIFAGLAVIGGVLAWSKYRQISDSANAGPAFEPAESIEITTSRTVQWQPTADLVGTVFSIRSVRVQNEVPGIIKQVHFQSGDIIEANKPLVSLDDSTDRAALDAAKAAVRVAEAGVKVADARIRLAESEYNRQQAALKERAASALEVERTKSEWDKALADRQRAAAEVDQAAARVVELEARLAKMVIRAPFRARAGIRTIHEGQYLPVQMMPNSPAIVTLEELSDKIYLDFAIPQEYVSRVGKGVRVTANSPMLGPDSIMIEVAAVDSAIDTGTRNVRVRALVDNKDQRLRAGMSVPIRVPTDEPKPVVVVPATAVRRASYADQVFLVVPGEKPGVLRAKSRFVSLGNTIGPDVVVTKGLEAGEQIAAGGSFKLRDGGLVVKAEPKPPTPSTPAAPAPTPAPK